MATANKVDNSLWPMTCDMMSSGMKYTSGNKLKNVTKVIR